MLNIFSCVYQPSVCVNSCIKSLGQNSAPIYGKNSSKLGIEGTYLNTVKAIYDKPIANVILNGENLKEFSPRSGTRQGCPLSPILFNTILEILATGIRGGKKGIQIGKEVKFSLYAGDMILYTKNTKNTIRKLLELITEFSKISGYKINTQKSIHLHSHILTMKNQKEKLRNQSHLPLQQKEQNIQE